MLMWLKTLSVRRVGWSLIAGFLIALAICLFEKVFGIRKGGDIGPHWIEENPSWESLFKRFLFFFLVSPPIIYIGQKEKERQEKNYRICPTCETAFFLEVIRCVECGTETVLLAGFYKSGPPSVRASANLKLQVLEI